MDYLKKYNHFHQKANTITKRIVIAEMKKAKEKNRPFSTVHNKICKDLYDYYTINYTNLLKHTYKESFDIYNERYSFYQGERDKVIKCVLEDEVLLAFKKDHSNSYSSFIADLATESSLKDAYNHFRNYKDYYELIYDLDKYEHFFFHDFEGISFSSSYYYKSMIDIKYPDRVKEREENLKIEDSKKSSINDTEKTKTKVGLDVEHSILESLNSFTDDERYLILSLLLSNERLSMNNVEKMKLIRIIGTYNDLSIFHKSSKQVTSYTKVNKGISYYGSTHNQINLLKSIILKLEPLNVISITAKLNMMLLECKKNKQKFN